MQTNNITTMKNCTKCDTPITGRFCVSCGKEHSPERLNSEYVLSELVGLVNLEKGFFYTLYNLSVRPGQSIKTFLLEDRTRFSKPVLYIVFCSLMFIIAKALFGFEDGYINFATEEDNVANVVFSWATQNYGYTNIVVALLIAAWMKKFFRRYDFSYFETLIMMCFITGNTMVYFSLFGILEIVSTLPIVEIGSFITTLYTIWAIGQFYERKRILNYLYALICYFLGLFTFGVAVLTIAAIIEAF